MKSLYGHMKRMLPVAENVGTVTEMAMSENWCGMYDRITITGKDFNGRSFELTLEIKLEKEEENHVEELE